MEASSAHIWVKVLVLAARGAIADCCCIVDVMAELCGPLTLLHLTWWCVSNGTGLGRVQDGLKDACSVLWWGVARSRVFRANCSADGCQATPPELGATSSSGIAPDRLGWYDDYNAARSGCSDSLFFGAGVHSAAPPCRLWEALLSRPFQGSVVWLHNCIAAVRMSA
jgi:hypothetical protein